MNPVYLRLLEIAREQGEVEPIPNTYFQKLLSLSSGRISQICDPLSVAKIGPKGLSNLANLGYNPKWVNDGPPNRKMLAPQGPIDTMALRANMQRQLQDDPSGMGPTEDDVNSFMSISDVSEDLVAATPAPEIRRLLHLVVEELEKTQGSFCTDFENQINDLSKAQVIDHGELITRISKILCEYGTPPKPAVTKLSPPLSLRDQRIAEINAKLAQTDDYGLVAMLEKSKDVARDYPLAKQTASSST